MKPPSEGRSSSPSLPDSALAALRKASAAVDHAQQREAKQQPKVDAINHKEVLTLNRDYFRLRKPLERRMYELARKYCGRQDEWSISLATLQQKCGSCSTPREFKRLVMNIAQQDQAYHHMPDYSVSLEDDDRVVFRNCGSIPCPVQETADGGSLDPETYHDARTLAPGWDISFLEREWRDWITEPLRDPDAAFLGFCRKWYERRGIP